VPLSWTSERADMLLVCERVRKAGAKKRQPRRAERAMHTEGAEAFFLCERRRRRIESAMREQLEDWPGPHQVRSAGYLAGLDARGADIESLGAAGHGRAYPLNVRVPTPVGLLLRPGHVVAESGLLAAYVTYRSHWSSLPNQVITGEMPDVGNRKRVPDRYQRRLIAGG
jgi:hypothetical protein